MPVTHQNKPFINYSISQKFTSNQFKWYLKPKIPCKQKNVVMQPILTTNLLIQTARATSLIEEVLTFYPFLSQRILEEGACHNLPHRNWIMFNINSYRHPAKYESNQIQLVRIRVNPKMSFLIIEVGFLEMVLERSLVHHAIFSSKRIWVTI